MDPTMTIIMATAVAFIAALLRAPIAIALLAGGITGMWALLGFDSMLQLLGSVPYGVVSNQSLLLVPLYVLIGMAVTTSGMADDLFGIAARTFRKLPGALGVSAVAACGAFSAVTGSSAATATTMSKVAYGPMVRQGYPAHLTAGMIAAGGTLGVLIPPSLMLVLYGIIAEESIGALLVAGLLPGVLVLIMYAIYVAIAARRLGITNADELDVELGLTQVDSKTGLRTKMDYSPVFHIIVIFTVTLAGIYAGFMTMTESAAVGALFALTIAATRTQRRGGSGLKVLSESLFETVRMTAVVFLLVIGGMVFSKFLVSTGVTGQISEAVQGLNASPYVILLMVILLMLPLGMFLDPMSIMLIFIPILHPLMVDVGFEGVWFAIIFVRMMEIAGITPPVGLNVFVVAGSIPGMKVETVFRGAFPFVVLDLVSVAILTAFPIIVMLLPNLLT